MKIAIVGAGAVGAYIGAHLAASGEEVTLIARGDSFAGAETQRRTGMQL